MHVYLSLKIAQNGRVVGWNNMHVTGNSLERSGTLSSARHCSQWTSLENRLGKPLLLHLCQDPPITLPVLGTGVDWGSPSERKDSLFELNQKVEGFLPLFCSLNGFEMVDGRSANDQKANTDSSPLCSPCLFPLCFVFEKGLSKERVIKLA